MPNVPDLSVKGWITSPLEKADKLLAHFYAAEFSLFAVHNPIISKFAQKQNVI
jgi:hypothetical protein